MRNRSLRVSLERNQPQPAPEPVDGRIRRAEIEANILLAKKHARDAAIGGIGVYAAVKTIKTLSEIAVTIAAKN